MDQGLDWALAAVAQPVIVPPSQAGHLVSLSRVAPQRDLGSELLIRVPLTHAARALVAGSAAAVVARRCTKERLERQHVARAVARARASRAGGHRERAAVGHTRPVANAVRVAQHEVNVIVAPRLAEESRSAIGTGTLSGCTTAATRIFCS